MGNVFHAIFHTIIKEGKILKQNRSFITYYLYLTLLTSVLIPLVTEYNVSYLGVSTTFLLAVTFVSIVIPTTLIADLVGGEKDRKSMESILSTPISVIAFYLSKVIFTLLITIFILFVIYVVSNIMYVIVGMKNGDEFYVYNTYSNIYFWINTIAISFLVASFGGLMSLKIKDVKTSNLYIMLIASPNIAIAYYILNLESYSQIQLMYAVALIIIGILFNVYIYATQKKFKVVMNLK